MVHLYIEHFWSIFIFFLTLLLSSSLLRQRRSPGSTLAWLGFIVVTPYVGIPLFLLIGGRKVKRIAAQKKSLYLPVSYEKTPGNLSSLERLLLSSGSPPRRAGNHVELLSDGNVAYLRIQELIASARHTIWISTFILGKDSVGDAILDSLGRRASEGIQVKLLIDGFGSFWINRKHLNELRRRGGQAAIFMPLLRMPFRGHSNLRNHRKIMVIDREIAILGGMNLATTELGDTPSAEASSRWLDVALEIRGPAVADIGTIFELDWKFATGAEFVDGSYSDQGGAGAGLVGRPRGEWESDLQVVASGPDSREDRLYDAILASIFAAKTRIWIATPYFIPDESICRALEMACRRGVDVRILLPARSNHLLADLGRGSYVRQLRWAGAKIVLCPRMIHAKVNLFDQALAVVGSANMDMRSLFLNFEACVFISFKSESDPRLKDIDSWFKSIMAQSTEKEPRSGWGSELLEGVGRVLGPML